MAYTLLRDRVTKLRLQGYTYSQIKRDLGISKSTLSDWLSNLPLTAEQLALLKTNRLLSRDVAREKYRLTMRRKRIERLKSILKRQNLALLPLTEKELFLAGLFLYWGEGAKHHGAVTISNSSVSLIKFVSSTPFVKTLFCN